ncbi:MAG: methylamine utilization protein MauJ, partial [Anaerolineae bacterium]
MTKRKKRIPQKKLTRAQHKVTNAPPLEFSLPRPDTSSKVKLTYVPFFSNTDPKSQIERSPAGSPGIYLVTFVFTLPGKNMLRGDLDSVMLMQSGESLLQYPANQQLVVPFTNENGKANIVFSSNKQGVIANAQMRTEAQDFENAERIANDLVAPLVSYWSYFYDVPMDIAGYEVVEERTDTRRYSFGIILGKPKPMISDEYHLVPDYHRMFAAYREAMNTTNEFYQALSFYKIVEGITTLRTNKPPLGGDSAYEYLNECFPENI